MHGLACAEGRAQVIGADSVSISSNKMSIPPIGSIVFNW